MAKYYLLNQALPRSNLSQQPRTQTRIAIIFRSRILHVNWKKSILLAGQIKMAHFNATSLVFACDIKSNTKGPIWNRIIKMYFELTFCRIYKCFHPFAISYHSSLLVAHKLISWVIGMSWRSHIDKREMIHYIVNTYNVAYIFGKILSI